MHDEAVYIRHRYTARELSDKLRRAGFQVEHVSYVNMLLFPLAALKRVSERFLPNRQNGSDLTIGAGVFNTPLEWILSLEAPFAARLRLPFGLTVVALARKATNRNG